MPSTLLPTIIYSYTAVYKWGNTLYFVDRLIYQEIDRDWAELKNDNPFGRTGKSGRLVYVAGRSDRESSSDITGLRMPDFYSLNVSVAIPNPYTGTIIGWSGSASIDRHGQIFVSPFGISVGKSALIGSVSLTGNYLLQLNKPTSEETYNFLSGHGISIGGGYIGGVNWTISPTNSSTKNALGAGVYTPQVGVSYNYTPDFLIFLKK